MTLYYRDRGAYEMFLYGRLMVIVWASGEVSVTDWNLHRLSNVDEMNRFYWECEED